MAFHNVVSGIFRQAAVIAVRFPTLLKSEDDLRNFLRQHGVPYAAALERLAESVQMELHISSVRAKPIQQPASGKGYLEERRAVMRDLASVTDEARSRIQRLATAWRVRAGKQPDTLRCYALIARQAEQDFRRALQSLPASPSIKTVVSGPWPCSEFLE